MILAILILFGHITKYPLHPSLDTLHSNMVNNLKCCILDKERLLETLFTINSRIGQTLNFFKFKFILLGLAIYGYLGNNNIFRGTSCIVLLVKRILHTCLYTI